MRKIFWVLNVTGFFLVLISCTNVQNKDNDNQSAGISDSLQNDLMDAESVIYLLPSPGEILTRFYNSQISYRPELLSSPKNKDKFIGSKAQALNLGVYITDMAYSALFERTTETVNYLDAVQSLSTETGISSSIFESLSARSKANAGNLDSLITISNEAFTGMLEFLESGGKETTISQVSAGAYIESLYILVQSIDNYSEDNEAIQLLAEMKYPMDNLLEKAKNESMNEYDSTLFNYLYEISSIFSELENSGSQTVVTEKEDGKLILLGGDQFEMNETNYNLLKIHISEIRKTLIHF